MSARVDVLAVLAKRKRGPSPDPDTGEDRGPCCAHAYAEGWNACVDAQAEARAAVAELLDADREFDAALFALQEVTRNVAERGWMEVQFDALRTAGERFHRARARRLRAMEAFGVQS